jgi:hypothetical protein
MEEEDEEDVCRNGVAPIALLCFTEAAQYLHYRLENEIGVVFLVAA